MGREGYWRQRKKKKETGPTGRSAPAVRRNIMNNEKSVTQSDSPMPAPSLSYDEIAARMRQALDTIDSLIPPVSMTMETTVPYIRQRVGVSPEVIGRAAGAAAP